MNAETTIVRDKIAKDLDYWRRLLGGRCLEKDAKMLKRRLVPRCAMPTPMLRLWKDTIAKIEWDKLVLFICPNKGVLAAEKAIEERGKLPVSDTKIFDEKMASLRGIKLSDVMGNGGYEVVTGNYVYKDGDAIKIKIFPNCISVRRTCSCIYFNADIPNIAVRKI